jgi:O-antigen ligase
MILPIALTLALQDIHRNVLARWFPVVSISLAALLSVSRSAIVGVLVGFVVLLPSLSPSVRRKSALAALGAVGVIGVLVPGMLGTIRGLFTGQDPSMTSRTNSYDTVLAFVELNPVVGRGFGTFLPVYRILDNQYLLLAIEIGLLGLLAFAVLLIAAIVVPLRASRHYPCSLGKVGPALAASMASGAVLTAFFDAFSFPQAAGLLFFTAGLSGAYWRMREAQGTQRYE